MSVHDLLANPLLGLQRGDMLRNKGKSVRVGELPVLNAGVHEWFLHSVEVEGSKVWYPPLTLLGALALPRETKTVAWIGRCCWPTLKLLHDLYGGTLSDITRRCIFIDPKTDKERFWVIEEVLRCSGVQAVVADGSGLTPTISRRLQLAAEMGGVTALIARPPREAVQPSWAKTRWRVRPVVGMLPRWEIAACRGEFGAPDAQWTLEYEVCNGKGALHLSAGVGCGSGTAEQQRRSHIA